MPRKPSPNAIHFSRKQLGKKKHVYTAQEIARLKSHALRLWKADNSHAIELGNALLAVRRALRGQHGAFKEWWDERNHLTQSRVSYCMDLASGKHGKRRKKSKSTELVHAARATQFVNSKLNKLFKTCASPYDALHSSGIPQQLREAIGATLTQAAKLAGWELNKPEVKQAAEAVDKAIATLISTLSPPSAAGTVTESLTKAASAE